MKISGGSMTIPWQNLGQKERWATEAKCLGQLLRSWQDLLNVVGQSFQLLSQLLWGAWMPQATMTGIYGCSSKQNHRVHFYFWQSTIQLQSKISLLRRRKTKTKKKTKEYPGIQKPAEFIWMVSWMNEWYLVFFLVWEGHKRNKRQLLPSESL